MTMHPKVDVLIIFYICPKKAVLKNKFKFDHSLVFHCIRLLFPHRNSLNFTITIFLYIFCLSHRKTCWIMSMDNVGLKICLLGISNFMITLTFFPWCKPKWSWGRVQQPITNLVHTKLSIIVVIDEFCDELQ